MVQPGQSPSDLVAGWARFDWRESFFAPGLAILQALTLHGETASGAGETREDALQRCLGETAEYAALRGAAALGIDPGFNSLRDGLAAHPDAALARQLAWCEMVERRAVAAWWLGQSTASRLADGWLADTGIAGRLARLRHGAALRRVSSFWLIARSREPFTMICASHSQEGQSGVLGYGTALTAVEAAEKAMREVLLMELNLMEQIAERHLDGESSGRPIMPRGAGFAHHLAQRLPFDAVPVTPPPGDAPDFTPEDSVEYRDLTPDGGPLCVWLCRSGSAVPRFPAPAFPAPAGSPFF